MSLVNFSCYLQKKEKADLMMFSVTSWKISHLAQARTLKKKSQTDQKKLWWIAWPTRAVPRLKRKTKIEVSCFIGFLWSECGRLFF